MQIAYFEQLYKSSDFMPHGDCLMWTPGLLWTHVGADILTGLSYYLITALIAYFIYKRRDILFTIIFVLFAAFVFACGTTHFMAAWTVYYPSYWTEGIVKTVNALVSCLTAIILIPLMPKILALPSLKKANEEILALNTKLRAQLNQIISENIKRAAAEAGLSENRATLRQILDTAPQSIFWKDMEGFYLGCNRVFANAAGLDNPEQIVGKSDFDLPWPKEEAEAYRADDLEVTRNKQAKRHIVEPLQQADGSRIWIDTTKVPLLDRDGKVIGVLGIFEDITERQLAEEERAELEKRLRQSQKMEAIGTLAGGIAHDFNNILSAIFGYTDFALEEEDPVQRRQDLEQVRLAAERARELVKQILAFSRRTEQERQPLQVGLIIKEALKMLRSSLPTTIEIRQEITSQGTVLADPTQIHQIIVNLCTNAAHSMRETGGTLALALGETEIRTADEGYGELAPGRYLKLEVSDTGSGIRPEILEKIFEPYFTTKMPGEGTGLGLAMVHGIVKSHHGHITVYSEPGTGTTVHVYLPLLEGMPDELPVEAVVTDLAGNGERIMFVDDEPQIRTFSERLMARQGYRVTSFSNGVQALEQFQNHADQFDLVITDMTMPNMTGAELAQKILTIRPELPIILCTGQSELINREKALAMGICTYLNKPVLNHDFLKAIRQALEKSHPPHRQG